MTAITPCYFIYHGGSKRCALLAPEFEGPLADLTWALLQRVGAAEQRGVIQPLWGGQHSPNLEAQVAFSSPEDVIKVGQALAVRNPHRHPCEDLEPLSESGAVEFFDIKGATEVDVRDRDEAGKPVPAHVIFGPRMSFGALAVEDTGIDGKIFLHLNKPFGESVGAIIGRRAVRNIPSDQLVQDHASPTEGIAIDVVASRKLPILFSQYVRQPSSWAAHAIGRAALETLKGFGHANARPDRGEQIVGGELGLLCAMYIVRFPAAAEATDVAVTLRALQERPSPGATNQDAEVLSAAVRLFHSDVTDLGVDVAETARCLAFDRNRWPEYTETVACAVLALNELIRLSDLDPNVYSSIESWNDEREEWSRGLDEGSPIVSYSQQGPTFEQSGRMVRAYVRQLGALRDVAAAAEAIRGFTDERPAQEWRDPEWRKPGGGYRDRLNAQRSRRTRRNRWKLRRVSGNLLRLSVERSHKHNSVQLIDDVHGCTLASASSREPAIRALIEEAKVSTKSKDAARIVGQELGRRAVNVGVFRVQFDRGRWPYTGRVKALANGARECGLDF